MRLKATFSITVQADFFVSSIEEAQAMIKHSEWPHFEILRGRFKEALYLADINEAELDRVTNDQCKVIWRAN